MNDNRHHQLSNEFEEWAMIEISKRELPSTFVGYQAVMNSWDNASELPVDQMLSCAKGTLICFLNDGVHTY